jgi:hypothetical protein
MKTSLRSVWYAAALAALSSAGAFAQSPTSLSIQLVSTFDYPGTGTQTRPQKISDEHDVVGIFLDSTGASFGFIRFNNGSFSDPLMDPADNGNITEGRGINNSHMVCGDYLNATLGTYHGFFFRRGSYQNYDVPDSTTTIVLGLNNAGDFAGSATPSGGIQEAFVSIGGRITEFAAPDATATLAYQINSTNQSCGYYIDVSGVTHGLWRDSDGTLFAPIDPVGSTGTILFGNNDRNLIVGRYSDAAGVTHGILFVPPNKFVVYDFPGSTFTSLNGINAQGQVVGRYTDSSGIDHGILAQVVRGGASLSLPLASPSSPVQQLPQGAPTTAPAY